jgi:hypothetical protein
MNKKSETTERVEVSESEELAWDTLERIIAQEQKKEVGAKRKRIAKTEEKEPLKYE